MQQLQGYKIPQSFVNRLHPITIIVSTLALVPMNLFDGDTEYESSSYSNRNYLCFASLQMFLKGLS